MLSLLQNILLIGLIVFNSAQLCQGKPIINCAVFSIGTPMKKQSLHFSNLVVTIHTPENCQGYILYVHGGPGGSSILFEKALDDLKAYSTFNYGWITYDQRECGRSCTPSYFLSVSHQDNINDLRELAYYLQNTMSISLVGILGHSYGGLLAYDTFLENPEMNYKLIFVGVSQSLHLPRNRSTQMDLIILKTEQPEDYKEAYNLINSATEPLWKHAKRIRELVKNPDRRRSFYWANPEIMNWYLTSQKELGVSADKQQTFVKIMQSMRDRYQVPHASIDPSKLTQKYLWILGYYDFLMGGDSEDNSQSSSIILFNKSAHYPHLEEAERFIMEVTKFLNERNR